MRFTSILFLLLLSTFSYAQNVHNFWQIQSEQSIALAATSEPSISVAHFQLYSLDLSAMRTALQNAPSEVTYNTMGRSSLVLSLPMPDGRIELFEVFNSPVFMPGLTERYPQIQSFGARGVANRNLHARLSYSPQGFQAAIATAEGKVHIDAYATNQTQYYISYFTKDVIRDQQFKCGLSEHESSDQPLADLHIDAAPSAEPANGRSADIVDLRVYRLAVSCTGEYGTNFGNSSTVNVLANFNAAVNRLNLIYEQEVAIRFMVIPNTDEVIYLNGGTDPFNEPTDGQGLLAQNQANLNLVIGSDNYDVGHIFTIGCQNNLGGIARRSSACTEDKGRGVTCFSSSNINAIVDEIMAHEIGHQFSAPHSWSNCPQFIDQLSPPTAWEPGSGSTIMSYAGACGNENIQFQNDVYFHGGNLEQIYEFSREGDGSTCGTVETTSNNEPVLELPYEDDFFIPIRTPFNLRANATDADNDNLTYCWEQMNTGPVAELGNPILNSPLFRSFPPTSSPERTFPRISNIVNGVSNETEVLPTYSRDLDFRCTVRDNNPEVGGVVWEDVSFKSTESAGPFQVTSPSSNVDWEVGSLQEVTWDVANTDNATVNCQHVNINLSISGGFSFPIALATNVPNDGSHFVVVPNNLTSDARIEVEAADNIFFNMSKPDFNIVLPASPTVFFAAGPYEQQVCLPETAIIDIELDSLLGYDSLVMFSVSGLPNGAVPMFDANPVRPTEASDQISIDMSGVTESGVFEVDIIISGPNISDITRTVFLEVISNDFSAFAPETPVNGATGVGELADFSWTDLPNVGSVILEIATSPTFGNTIVETATILTGNTFTVSTLLEKNTPYFWRIRPVNDCGEGDFSSIWAFQTETLSCAALDYSGDDINISAQGMPVIESKINVPSGGAIK